MDGPADGTYTIRRRPLILIQVCEFSTPTLAMLNNLGSLGE